MSKSSFWGKIDEFPSIRVDNFENAARERAAAYFLSHCHSDHTQGLYTRELIKVLEETGACIYMSEGSAAIVEDETCDVRLMKFVRPVRTLETKVVIIPSDTDSEEKEYLNVTLLPAAHCLGSVMFLFESTKNKKTVLYTGDFRLSTSDVERMKYFHKQGTHEPLKIDALYVDTTFIEDKYQSFPKRSDSVEVIVDEIEKHFRKHGEGGRVALHTSAKYGYEFVFNTIQERLGLKVYVDDARWRVYSKLSDSVKGVTNNPDGVKIHNCRNRSENMNHTNCVPRSLKDNSIVNNREVNDGDIKHEYLYIHFSALKWSDCEVEGESFYKISDNRIDVCFATHCSSTEVRYFIDYFSPKKVHGFPNVYKKYVSPTKSVDALLLSPKRRRLDQVEHKEKRVSREMLRKMFEF